MLEREFYRNARGAKPTDQDAWLLVYDDKMKRLFVRHEFQDSSGRSSAREYPVNEFIEGHGIAADALIEFLFKRTRVHA